MDKQWEKEHARRWRERGGSFTVSGWLALTLLAMFAAVSLYTIHLLHHRTIEIKMSEGVHLGPTVVRPTDDYYVIHSFPTDYRANCDGFDTICYSRI